MPDITFDCPHCHQTIEAPEEMAGMAGECPGCQSNLHIPQKPAVAVRAARPKASAQVSNRDAAILGGIASASGPAAPHFIAANCPSCGGDLRVPDNRASVKCMYCGGDIVLRRDPVADSSVINCDRYRELARSAEQAENFEEACKYFTLILESEPDDVEAWLGKGRAAASQSTLARPRLAEMVACYAKLTELNIQDQRLLAEAANDLARMAKLLHSVAFNHLREYVALRGSFADYAAFAHGCLIAVDRAAHIQATGEVKSEYWAIRTQTTQLPELMLIHTKNTGENPEAAVNLLVNDLDRLDAMLCPQEAKARRGRIDQTKKGILVCALIGVVAIVISFAVGDDYPTLCGVLFLGGLGFLAVAGWRFWGLLRGEIT